MAKREGKRIAYSLTKQDIVQGLKKLGVTKGMELEVHSSLSKFGYVAGGADTVISALKEACGENGSIFMPALRLSPEYKLTKKDKQLGITQKIKILPANCERSAMGIIADTFRKLPDTQTGEGVFRISGWGKNADKAVSGGLDHVIHHGGKALLLGVDIYKLTAMHYVENLLPAPIKDMFRPNDFICTLYPPDQWLIEAGAPPVKAWYTIQKMAYEKNMIKDAKIGTCPVMFFDIGEVVQLYARQLQEDPYKLYGLEK